MKTQISLKDDKFFWEQKKNPGKYGGKAHWILTQNDDTIAVIFNEDSEGVWRLDPTRGLGTIFDSELRFSKEVSAQQYVENKFLKWIKNIISIRI
jgi:hypothetical protein